VVQVTVDRKKWLRGEGDTYSFLLRETDQKMCCIGFLAKQIGASDEEILNCSTLNQVHTNEANAYVDANGNDLAEAYRINDSDAYTDTNREELLVQLGKRMGVEFTFEG
jgi:hypothetical protein